MKLMGSPNLASFSQELPRPSGTYLTQRVNWLVFVGGEQME